MRTYDVAAVVMIRRLWLRYLHLGCLLRFIEREVLFVPRQTPPPAGRQLSPRRGVCSRIAPLSAILLEDSPRPTVTR